MSQSPPPQNKNPFCQPINNEVLRSSRINARALGQTEGIFRNPFSHGSSSNSRGHSTRADPICQSECRPGRKIMINCQFRWHNDNRLARNGQ